VEIHELGVFPKRNARGYGTPPYAREPRFFFCDIFRAMNMSNFTSFSSARLISLRNL
jgi:hypothetical protein